MDALTAYRLFAADPKAVLDRVSNRPEVSREVDYYRENISNVKTIDDLVDNRRLFNFVMEAYGLGEMSYARGFVRRLLEGGIDDPDSMANRLTDPRYRDLATDFNFVRYDTSTTAFSRVTEGVVERYLRTAVEVAAGDQNDGARLAIYFENKVSEIDSYEAILTDAALLAFVQTSYGLPREMSFLSIDRQVEMMEKRFDLEDLKDPEKTADAVRRFLVDWDTQNPATASVPSLLIGTGETIGFSMDLLMSIQKLNTGK